MPNLTDLSTIRDVCARHDFALSKGSAKLYHQPRHRPRIAEAAALAPAGVRWKSAPASVC